MSSSRATCATDSEVSTTILAASCLNSGENFLRFLATRSRSFPEESYWIPCPGTVGRLKGLQGPPIRMAQDTAHSKKKRWPAREGDGALLADSNCMSPAGDGMVTCHNRSCG